jgi:tRNA pseudouridine32 synthase / 23S rRNA pseudouridine746 synthase
MPASGMRPGPAARDPDTVGPVSDWAQIRAAAVLYEDDAALVLNKPAGLSVMGERHDTDLVRLAEEAGEKLYPAHRIDKVTSGVLLLAKDLALHGDLTRQFNRRTVDKVYLAITATTGLPGRGTIELPLSVGRKNRVRVAANRAAIAFDPACSRWSIPADEQFQDVRSYPSTTTFQAVRDDAGHTLLAVCPLTGRRHQIRVHLAWIGHPIEGDPLFDKAATGRTLLHSWRLGFDAAWDGGRRVRVEAPPGPDFWAALPGGAVPLPGWEATSAISPGGH